MARFDVYAFNAPNVPFVVDVQADFLDPLNTRLVIPLNPKESYGGRPLDRLHPTITLDGTDYLLMTTDMATLPTAKLGERLDNLEDDYRLTITDAIDFLLQGF